MISVYWRDHELYQHEVFRKASGPPMLRRYVNTQRERKQNSLLSFLFAKRNQYTNWRGDTRLWPLDHQRSSFLFESSKTILPFNNNFGFCIFYKLNMFCIFCIVCIFCIFTKEKFYILRKPEMASLNSRQDVGNHCRHIAMSLLSNVGKVKVTGMLSCLYLWFCHFVSIHL